VDGLSKKDIMPVYTRRIKVSQMVARSLLRQITSKEVRSESIAYSDGFLGTWSVRDLNYQGNSRDVNTNLKWEKDDVLCQAKLAGLSDDEGAISSERVDRLWNSMSNKIRKHYDFV